MNEDKLAELISDKVCNRLADVLDKLNNTI
jgi:hypothetical protein